MSAGWYQAFQIGYIVGLVALVSLMTFVPLRRVRAGTNLLVLAASVFVAAQLVMTYQAPAQPVTVSSPLGGQWYVGQGGHAELVNYHHVTKAQSDALDILQVVDGQTHRAGSTALDSYYIYGKSLLAPVDGVVTSVVDGLADQPIGSVDLDPANQAGNQVVIDAGGGRYIMFGHIRPGTIRVAVGDRVRTGEVMAQVGNSGNTDEPHVHIQAMNLPELDLGTDDPIGLLRSIRTFPLVFRDVTLTRGGTVSDPALADPRRGDLVAPVH
jgi:murein DD-endopeptidase MepM/ murein hydrolase activator NlpD